MRRKKPCAGSTTVAVTLAVFLLFFTLITLYLFAAKYWRPPDPITSFGREIDQQFARTFLITGIVFVLSQLALGWVVFRFRDTGGRATFSHGNTTMEVLWTLATLVLFVGLGIYAESLDGRVKLGGSLDPGQPYAGQLRQCSIILPKGMDGQQVKLRAELEVKGVRRPVRWACHERTNPDGSLTIRLKKASDPDWKKGV